jgi:hypothetical protein
MNENRPADETEESPPAIEIDPELPISASLARSLRRRDAETRKLLRILQSFERANYELHDQVEQGESRDRRPDTPPPPSLAEPSDANPTTINIEKPANVFLGHGAGRPAEYAQPPADALSQSSPEESHEFSNS